LSFGLGEGKIAIGIALGIGIERERASVAAPLCGAFRRRVQRDGYTER